ncbi:prolyl oligopeptidase family serine peptidase [Bacillus spongiae]|uniref:Prolyl oligopeptidase family serine peptidase n=1 Tax=Bacillus spongiae TaxID=2683610 RepID=A0ABU8HB10_9BACI
MIMFPKPDPESFFLTVRIGDFAVSHDEDQLIYSTNLNGKFNIWGMDLPNHSPYQMTSINQYCHHLSFEKEGRFILTSFDQDGDENSQIYALSRNGGALVPLCSEKSARHLAPILSNDGERVYYTSNKKNKSYLSSFVYHISTKEDQLLLDGEHTTTYLTAVSPDESHFVYLKQFSSTNINFFLHSNDEKFTILPKTEQEYTVGDVIFTSNQTMYFTTNFDADVSYLMKYNLKRKQYSKIAHIEGYEMKHLQWEEKSNRLYVYGSSGVRSRVFQLDLDEEEINEVVIPVTSITKFLVGNRGNCYILGSTDTRPDNIYMLPKEGTEWKEITNHQVIGASRKIFVESEVVHYPSFDGLMIEGLYYRSKSEVENGYTIVWPHGGPQFHEQQQFKSFIQLATSKGYNFFQPNFRGSTGYGLSFSKMVEKDWGYGPRLDIVHGIEWLAASGRSDLNKIFLLGASYGGYMSLLLHGRHPEYFQAIVDICGPSNLFSFINSVPDFWKPFLESMIGHPEKDKEKLIEDSPITYLKSMKKPMLIIQGANDPSVVKEESDQIVERLWEYGREVEYIILEDEGHGINKKANEIKVFKRIFDFFQENQK